MTHFSHAENLSFNRRRFMAATGSAFAALGASGCSMASADSRMAAGDVARAGRTQTGYGALVSDPDGMLDLPEGFSYRVLSRLGDTMSDGLSVPDKADGMGAITSWSRSTRAAEP